VREQSIISDDPRGISETELRDAVVRTLEGFDKPLKKVLLIPPDYTRLHSGAGAITALYYGLLKDGCRVDILPALGTHDPMTEEECRAFFGDGVPFSVFIRHDWRRGVVRLGEVPGAFVREASEGLMDEPIAVELNRLIIEGNYDLIVSVGQVVPHEVAGMANYSKNLFVGCGGSNMINSSHMLGAFYGLERIMGRDRSPVRRVFDYAEERFIRDLPLLYVMTVTSCTDGKVNIHGLFTGRSRKRFEEAVALSRKRNLIFVDRPIRKAVVFLDEKEFKSAWLGNKAIYRTRMAIADGGELVVIAPGVRKFGEDGDNDALIRKYGYAGRENILKLTKENRDLRDNLSVAAHLIHGSPDGRFTVTYAAGRLTKEEVESVFFKYTRTEDALAEYDCAALKPGFNTVNGEEIFYVGNPALGLWADRNKFPES